MEVNILEKIIWISNIFIINIEKHRRHERKLMVIINNKKKYF